MKKVRLIEILLVSLIFSFTLLAQQVKEKAVPDTSTKGIELPPEIEELIKKEYEKLPPVERHFRMAQHYHSMGKLKDAIKELQEALKIDPKHVPSNCELGVIYLGEGKFEEAIVQLKRTLKLDPNYPKAHYALANVYARKPNPDVKLAREHLDKAIKLGYHPVPWFLEYMKRLEKEKGIKPEK